MTERQATDVDPTSQQHDTPSQIDRRGFFRGAAALTVGGFGATTGLAQTHRAPSGRRRVRADASRAARSANGPRAALGRARSGRLGARAQPASTTTSSSSAAARAVSSIAYGLRRKGVGRVEVIDRAAPGQAGIWRSIARMHQLRTPKTHGGTGARQSRAQLPRVVRDSERPGGVRRARSNSAPGLGRLPRLVSASHGHDGALRHAARRDRAARRRAAPAPRDRRRAARRDRRASSCSRTATPAPAGRTCPTSFVRCRANVWTHTTGSIPFDALAARSSASSAPAPSAFDAAAVALESGASEVHMFSRRLVHRLSRGSRPPPGATPPPPPAPPSTAATATCSS